MFLDQLESLARQLLSTDHLPVKMVAGREVTCEELLEFFLVRLSCKYSRVHVFRIKKFILKKFLNKF